MAKYDFYLKRKDDNSITKGVNADIEFIKSMLYKLEWKGLKNVKAGTEMKGKHKSTKTTDKNKITR